MIQCKSCQCYLWNEETVNKGTWDCEFCGASNDIPKKATIPRGIQVDSSNNSNTNNSNSNTNSIRVVDYVVVPPPNTTTTTTNNNENTPAKKKMVSGDEDSLVVFVVDISGSMST